MNVLLEFPANPLHLDRRLLPVCLYQRPKLRLQGIVLQRYKYPIFAIQVNSYKA